MILKYFEKVSWHVWDFSTFSALCQNVLRISTKEIFRKHFFADTSWILASLTSWHEAAFVNLFFDLFYQKSLFSATSSSKVSQLGWNPWQFFHESFGLISAVLFRLRARSFLSFLYLCITQKALQFPLFFTFSFSLQQIWTDWQNCFCIFFLLLLWASVSNINMV